MSRRLTEVEWEEIAREFDAGCVLEARSRLDADGFVRLTPEELGAERGCTAREAERLLQHLAALDAVSRVEVQLCPRCEQTLMPEEAQGDACPYCAEAFDEHPEGIPLSVGYERVSEQGRSVPWVLALHGMNTRGAWQEDFNWLVATTYGRSVPVFVYKYGLVRPGALLKWRQRMLRDRLASKVRRLTEGLGDRQPGTRPDVIAHSFGTWLIGHALLEHEDLRVDRVILMGSVLRPDFPWNEVVQRDQAEAIMNHFGRRDVWAGIAGYFIPESGPSGRRGFDSGTGALNHPEPRYGHSAFFDETAMRKSYEELWRPFLQRPRGRLTELGTEGGQAAWKPAPLFLRAMLPRWVLLGLAAAIGLTLVTALVLGLIRLVELLA